MSTMEFLPWFYWGLMIVVAVLLIYNQIKLARFLDKHTPKDTDPEDRFL